MLSEIKSTIEKQFDIPLNNYSITKSKEYKHILTHQIILARFYLINLLETQNFNSNKKLIEVNADTISKYPVPRLIEKFLQENNIFER